MATIRDAALPALLAGRRIIAATGLHRYRVFVRRRTWPGDRPGLGIPEVVTTEILPRPHVRELQPSELAESKGTYRQGDLLVDWIQPVTGAAGYTPEQLDVAPEGTNQDVCYIVQYDQAEPEECQLVARRHARPLHHTIVLRSTVGPVRG